MGNNSTIQWTDHTWNIARGCSKVDADCKFCYMYRQSLNNSRYDPAQVIRTKTVFNLPLKIKGPSKIFTCSLTDFFHSDIDSYRHEAWDIIRKCPQHTFQILTKRPERILECLPEDWGVGWDNVWLGTSVGSQTGEQRITDLISVPCKIRFLSIEPLWARMDLGWYLRSNGICPKCFGAGSIPVPEGTDYDDGGNTCPKCEHDFRLYMGPSNIHWVIVGGESGNDNGKYRYRPCELGWLRKIITDCKNNSVPVFMKQLGTHLSKHLGLKDRHGGDMDEWPEDLKVREFPR